MTREALEKHAGYVFDMNLVKRQRAGIFTWPALVLRMIDRHGLQ
jgi:hypothetical protein